MSFRLRTTRFGTRPAPPTPAPPQLPFGFGSIATQVSQVRPVAVRPTFRPTTRPRTPTARRRVSKAQRFVRPIRRPEPRPTVRGSSFIPFQRAFAEPARPIVPITRARQIRRIGKAEREVRPLPERVFKPSARPSISAPPPKRDDVEVATLPERIGVTTREFLGVPAERIATRPSRIVQRPSGEFADIFSGGTSGIIQVRPPVSGGDILLPSGRIVSAEEQAAPRFGDPAIQRQIEREAGGVPLAFQSFVGGARQEFENIGAIAGIGTARPEAGSLIFGLPFEVGGATFTREAPEGEGFAGLGFEFAFSPQRGAEVSGEIQRQIVQKFEEDPFRAAGSVVTAGTIEAAIFVGTGGLGRVGLTAAKKFTQIKGRKVAERLRLDVFKEKGVGSVTENIGKDTFLIVQGTETAAKRGIVLSPFEAVAVSLKRTIGGGFETVLSKTPTIRGIARSKFRKRKGKLAKIPATKAFVKIEESAKAKIPLIVVQTNVKVAGQRGRKTVVTTFTRDEIKNLGFPTDATIRGVTDPKLLGRLGLESVGGKATIVQGKLKGGAVRTLIETTEAGRIRKVGTGAQFLAEDFFANPITLRQIALTGKTIRGTPARLTTTEIFEAQAFGGAKFVREAGRGIKEPIFFGSKAEAAELSRLGLGDVGRIPKSKAGKPFDFEKAAQQEITRAEGVGAVSITPAGRVITTARPTQAVDDIAQIFRDVGKSSAKQTRELRAVGVPITAFRTGLDFDVGSFVSPIERQEQIRTTRGIQSIIPALDVDVGLKQRPRQLAGLDIFAPTKQRQLTRSIVDEGLVRTPEFRFGIDERFDFGTIVGQRFQPFTPLVPATTPTFEPPVTTTRLRPVGILPFGLPPFGEPRRRRKVKRRPSRLGGRLFDIATEPFGEVEVGLGFFIEQTSPEQTIAEAIGTADIEFEPITRQERQARARLGINKKRKRKSKTTKRKRKR